VGAAEMSSAGQESPDVNLHTYLAAMRRRKRLIISVTLLGLAAGIAYSLFWVPTYGSTASVEVKSITLQPPSRTSVPGLALEEKEVAGTMAVATLAKERLGSPESPQTLLIHLSLQAVGDSVLNFSYSSRDPVDARNGAQAFADAYVALKEQQGLQTYQDLRRPIYGQIRNLTSRIARVSRRIASSPPTSATRDAASPLLASLLTQVAELRTRLASLTPLALSPARVIEAAEVPSTPTTPNPVIGVVAGSFLGLICGSALALLQNRRGDRWRGALDLEESLGAPVVGLIPRGPKRDLAPDRLITVRDPRGPASEAYRKLRAHVFASAGVKTLLVTSLSPEKGRSATAANLAVTLAQAGKRTILVSADLRRPGVDRLFPLRPHKGLSEVLSGEAQLGEALQYSGVSGLWVLASGRASTRDIELLQSDSIVQVLQARDLVDYIIIDSAPLDAVADALALAPLVDGVVLVADARRTRRGAVSQAHAELEQVQARVLGVIMNGVRARTPRSYRYRKPRIKDSTLAATTRQGETPTPTDGQAWLWGMTVPRLKRQIDDRASAAGPSGT
jgi:tyrosine-protein kinase